MACSKAAMVFSGWSLAPPRWANAIGPGWSRYGQGCTALARGAGGEDGRAVVAKLGHALADVAQRPVGSRFDGGGGERLRVPAAAELLHRRYVDGAVVQVVVQLGKMGGQEAPVGADGVAAERGGLGLGHVALDELEGDPAG